MEKPPTTPDPGEEPTDDAENASPPKPLPPFKPATDGVEDVHMEANPAVGKLAAKGKFFRPGRADAVLVAELIRTFALALYKIALSKGKLGDVVAPSDLSELKIASAHITFVAGKHETFRIDGSPTLEAAEEIANLMQSHGDELMMRAQETGPDGARAYKQFVRAVSQAEDAEVTWEASGRKELATITSSEASKAFSILDREGEPDDQVLEAIPGHLSMADAGVKRFKLELPSGREFDRPTPLKGKRVVEGQYDAPVGDSVMEKGLWNKDVIATIRVEREKAETVAAPRKPKFHLVAVESVIEDRSVPSAEDLVPEAPSLLDDDERAAG